MPIELPNLDDRSYDDLVQEALSMIPTYAPEWTNHNPSDPGITLIELFAYLTEMLLYRQNRVTDDNLRMFLKLINGPDWEQTKDLREEVGLAIVGVRQRYRAVTCEDFEELAKEVDSRVARAHCVPKRNLDLDPLVQHGESPGHISIIIVPVQPEYDLKQVVKDYLQPRRLLTTAIHVVEPRYVKIRVHLTVFLKQDAPAAEVQSNAEQTLQEFFDPLTGGTEGKGWHFGRNVYISEVYELLDHVSGVDYVKETQDEVTGQKLDELQLIDELASSETERLIRNTNGELIGIQIKSHELVAAEINLTTQSPLELE